MKKQRVLSLILGFLISIIPACSFELVLPKEKKTIVNSNYAFFVGKARKSETISINDEVIFVAKNGAFAHTVKLKEGDNRVIVKSNYSTKIYEFYKAKPAQYVAPILTEQEPELYVVCNDNTPLRSTPVDAGMNRMGHLFAGTKILVTGQQGSFLRVYLSKDKVGWIAKTSVKQLVDVPDVPCFVTMNSESYKNAIVRTVEFTDKLPYTIDETDDEIIFKIYNPQDSEETVYTINMPKYEKYYYTLTLEGGTYRIKENSLPAPEHNNLEDITIVVDAGHGGAELGAIGCLGDKEKDINLLIAIELQKILASKGANVIMTRECDATVPLNDRVDIAKNNKANIFVSIHLNSIGDIKMDIRKNSGTSVYYYNQNSKELAQLIEASTTKTLKTRNDGIHTASFAVLRPTDYVGVLVETAYMTNPIDSMLYKSDKFAKRAAKGIANGIIQYVNSSTEE